MTPILYPERYRPIRTVVFLFLGIYSAWIVTDLIAAFTPVASAWVTLLPAVVCIQAALVYQRKRKRQIFSAPVRKILVLKVFAWVGLVGLLFAGFNALSLVVLFYFHPNLPTLALVSLTMALIALFVTQILDRAHPRVLTAARALVSAAALGSGIFAIAATVSTALGG